MAVNTTDDRNGPLEKALTHGLAFWAVVAPLWVLVNSALGGNLALDFRHAFLPATHAVLQGRSPYSALGSRALEQGTAFLYPPLGAYLLAPFTLLPPVIAETLAVLLVVVAVPATLLVLDVRDWRCYALGFLWWPTIIGIQTANFTLPMLLGLALAWRYRDRTVGIAVTAIVVALKLFFWPVLVWLVATRRYRAAVLAAGSSAALILLPWLGIGFAGLGAYPRILGSVSRHEGPLSFSVAAIVRDVVHNWMAATAVGIAAGAALLVIAFVIGRRGRDRDAFALSIVAILVLTPLVEMHYFALLLVVVALYQPRFGVAWAIPLLIWGASANGPNGSTIQAVHVLAVVAATVAYTLGDRPSRFARPGGRPDERSGLPLQSGRGPVMSPP